LVVMLLPVITIMPRSSMRPRSIEEIGQPRHGLQGMAERVPGLALAAGLVVHPGPGHGGLEVELSPRGHGRAETTPPFQVFWATSVKASSVL
jgi:hypothetical protein